MDVVDADAAEAVLPLVRLNWGRSWSPKGFMSLLATSFEKLGGGAGVHSYFGGKNESAP